MTQEPPKQVLLHTDGGCGGLVPPSGACSKCGIAPSMQDTEFWESVEAYELHRKHRKQQLAVKSAAPAPSAPTVEVGFSMGRHYLAVNGYVVAVEGERCWDSVLPGTHWDEKNLNAVVAGGRAERLKGLLFKQPESLPRVDAVVEYRAQRKKERDLHERFVDAMIEKTEAVVQANAFEMHVLWAENQRERPTVLWHQESSGFNETVGVVRVEGEEFPIVVSGFWARLNGRAVFFWECCSRYVDMVHVEEWVNRTFPNAKVKTNAMNFHNVIHHLRSL